MNQIRPGLENGVDASKYADPKFDYGQMEEIRKGLENGVNLLPYYDFHDNFDYHPSEDEAYYAYKSDDDYYLSEDDLYINFGNADVEDEAGDEVEADPVTRATVKVDDDFDVDDVEDDCSFE